MEFVARFLSDKHDDIFVLARKPGTLAEFKDIPKAVNHNGWVIDLDDEEGCPADTVIVDPKTIEDMFKIVVKSEDELYEDSQKAWTDGLIRAGFDPDTELAKVNKEMYEDTQAQAALSN